ncbi:hypothetical protein [Microbacterium sp. PMB16]|uniref:hypothetical protein n=1 Tax=Microbacterium sp. PMB16 TaxID=3120157 RepID=UPI003F4C5957
MPIIGLVNPSAKPIPEALWWLFVFLLAFTAWLWLRFPFTGPRIAGDYFVLNSWFSRRVFHREKLQRFRAEEYEGIIFFFAWTISEGSLRSGELEVELSDGTVTRLKGTMCNYREVRMMAEAGNRWLGIEVGAGTGPRRSLRARPSTDGTS